MKIRLGVFQMSIFVFSYKQKESGSSLLVKVYKISDSGGIYFHLL